MLLLDTISTFNSESFFQMVSSMFMLFWEMTEFANFSQIPMVKGRNMINYGPNRILDFNTSFERSLSLSFQKIIKLLQLDQ